MITKLIESVQTIIEITFLGKSHINLHPDDDFWRWYTSEEEIDLDLVFVQKNYTTATQKRIIWLPYSELPQEDEIECLG